MKLFQKLSAVLLVALAVGCVSFNATVYNSEKTTADAAAAAVHAYNEWYSLQTNNASGADIAKLNEQRDTVYDVSRKMSASLALVNSLRLAYATNSADTNKLALQSGLDALTYQSSNVVAIVHLFLTQ